jgi:hypothetical protein
MNFSLPGDTTESGDMMFWMSNKNTKWTPCIICCFFFHNISSYLRFFIFPSFSLSSLIRSLFRLLTLSFLCLLFSFSFPSFIRLCFRWKYLTALWCLWYWRSMNFCRKGQCYCNAAVRLSRVQAVAAQWRHDLSPLISGMKFHWNIGTPATSIYHCERWGWQHCNWRNKVCLKKQKMTEWKLTETSRCSAVLAAGMCGSWSSSVDIVTTLQRGRPDESARFLAEATIVLYTTSSRPDLRFSQIPMQWVKVKLSLCLSN